MFLSIVTIYKSRVQTHEPVGAFPIPAIALCVPETREQCKNVSHLISLSQKGKLGQSASPV